MLWLEENRSLGITGLFENKIVLFYQNVDSLTRSINCICSKVHPHNRGGAGTSTRIQVNTGNVCFEIPAPSGPTEIWHTSISGNTVVSSRSTFIYLW